MTRLFVPLLALALPLALLPAAVGTTPRRERSSSFVPAAASSARNRFESAGWLIFRETAARPRVPRSTAAQKARSSAISGPRIVRLACFG